MSVEYGIESNTNYSNRVLFRFSHVLFWWSKLFLNQLPSETHCKSLSRLNKSVYTPVSHKMSQLDVQTNTSNASLTTDWEATLPYCLYFPLHSCHSPPPHQWTATCEYFVCWSPCCWAAVVWPWSVVCWELPMACTPFPLWQQRWESEVLLCKQSKMPSIGLDKPLWLAYYLSKKPNYLESIWVFINSKKHQGLTAFRKISATHLSESSLCPARYQLDLSVKKKVFFKGVWKGNRYSELPCKRCTAVMWRDTETGWSSLH